MTGRRGAVTSYDSEPERTFLRLKRKAVARGKRVVGEEEEEEEEDPTQTMEAEAHNHMKKQLATMLHKL